MDAALIGGVRRMRAFKVKSWLVVVVLSVIVVVAFVLLLLLLVNSVNDVVLTSQHLRILLFNYYLLLLLFLLLSLFTRVCEFQRCSALVVVFIVRLHQRTGRYMFALLHMYVFICTRVRVCVCGGFV